MRISSCGVAVFLTCSLFACAPDLMEPDSSELAMGAAGERILLQQNGPVSSPGEPAEPGPCLDLIPPTLPQGFSSVDGEGDLIAHPGNIRVRKHAWTTAFDIGEDGRGTASGLDIFDFWNDDKSEIVGSLLYVVDCEGRVRQDHPSDGFVLRGNCDGAVVCGSGIFEGATGTMFQHGANFSNQFLQSEHLNAVYVLHFDP